MQICYFGRKNCGRYLHHCAACMLIFQNLECPFTFEAAMHAHLLLLLQELRSLLAPVLIMHADLLKPEGLLILEAPVHAHLLVSSNYFSILTTAYCSTHCPCVVKEEAEKKRVHVQV